MHLSKLIAVLVLAFSLSAAQCQKPAEELHAPSNTDPQEVLIVNWHRTLIANDFVAYEKITFSMPGIDEKLKRDMFQALKVNLPPTFKLTKPKINPNGSLVYYAVGCAGNRRMISLLTLANTGGSWKVAPSGWGPPWNDTVNKCPV